MFVILPRVLPRATAEILIMVFDRDLRCYRYTRSKKRRYDYLLKRTTLSFTFYAYILRPRRTTQRPARSLSARSLLRALLCASRFSRVRCGTLKADNRMRSINHSIHLISAIVYTDPFTRLRIAPTGDARAIEQRSDQMCDRVIKFSRFRINYRDGALADTADDGYK